MKYVDLDYTIAYTKRLVKTADDMDTNYWKDWIYTGAMIHLGVGDDEIEVAELVPTNNIAKLPEHLRTILKLALFDSAGDQLAHKFRPGQQRIYTDERLLSTVVSDADVNDYVPVDVSNDSYNLIFGTNGDLVAKVYIRYFKYPLDSSGQPMIRLEDVHACAMFIKFMQAVRDDSNKSAIQLYDQLWKQAADHAKAAKRAQSLTPEVAETIIRDWMRLIPSFDFKQF
jgi:hypothetical protein